MKLRLLVASILAFTRAFAAFDNGPSGAINSTTPTAKDGNRTIHYIDVGKTTNEFVPNSIKANVGDIVSFRFYPTNHSVIRSEYGYPCIPIEDIDESKKPFYSGFYPVESSLKSPPTWNLTINDTSPIFFYCGATGSCTDWGMLGVINANASTSLATQIRLAHQADYMLLPGEKFPSEAQMASLESLAATATTKTVTATATPTHHKTSTLSPVSQSESQSSISSGAAAGIAVGAVGAAAGLAALFFLLRRTRTLKKQLYEKAPRAGSEGSGSPEPRSRVQTFMAVPKPDDNRHSGQQAPPYRPYHHLERPGNEPVRVESWAATVANSGGSRSDTPYQDSPQFRSYTSPDPNRGTFNSELHGNVPPVELDTSYRSIADVSDRDMRWSR